MRNAAVVRNECPICLSAHFQRIDYRENTPVLMNRLYASPEEARSAKTAALDLVCCEQCGFTWNRLFDANAIEYDENYENDQSHSGVFSAHLHERAEQVLRAFTPDEPIDYLEVGCGQGHFMSVVKSDAGNRIRSVEGFDPAWRGEDMGTVCGARVHKVYFSAATSSRLAHQPNVVVSRHTIEHVPDPMSFLRTIRGALGGTSRARIFIETPCISWILEHNAFQDVFYEHCSIFNTDSLKLAMRKAGFEDVVVQHVFGGQYLWAKGVAGLEADLKPDETTGPHRRPAKEEYMQVWRSSISQAVGIGRIGIWGAGAKGITFSLLFDGQQTLFDCAIDVNPAKQGLYLPVTGLKVVSPDEAAKRDLRTIYVMNPNYLGEIEATARAKGISARFVAID